MNQKGGTDRDLGYEKIMAELQTLGKMSVKAGIPSNAGDGEGGVAIAQYAAWNEYGVKNRLGRMIKTFKLWKIPPRPFMRGWFDSNQSAIKQTMEKVYKLVSAGKITAHVAIHRLGTFGQDGIRKYIQNGPFVPNSPSTKARKNSDRPLIDGRNMLGAVRYQVLQNGTVSESSK